MFKKTVAIDFDGVIHAYTKGWQGGEIYDAPVPGVGQALETLSETYRIIIFTSRTEHQEIWVWLDEWGLAGYIEGVTNKKPPAVAYIDDRGVAFRMTGDGSAWVNAIEEVHRLAEGREHGVAPAPGEDA